MVADANAVYPCLVAMLLGTVSSIAISRCSADRVAPSSGNTHETVMCSMGNRISKKVRKYSQ